METNINVNINNENTENKILHEKPETSENIQLVSNNNKNNNYSPTEIDNESDNQITISNDNQNDIIDSSIESKKGLLTVVKPHYIYLKLGNTYTFFGDKDGSPYIVIGPHWFMYAWFCSIMSAIYLFFFIHYWNHMNFLFKLTGLIAYLTYFISYTFIFVSNPGIPKYDENAILGKPREKYTFCRRCGIWRNMDKNAYHCFDCDICIEGYDHHCPWTGKCVAKNNVNGFYVFLVSILGAFCFFITALTHAQHNIYLEKKNNLIKKFL